MDKIEMETNIENAEENPLFTLQADLINLIIKNEFQDKRFAILYDKGQMSIHDLDILDSVMKTQVKEK